MSTLTQTEADLFFKLMWAAQFYVNQHLKLIPGVKTVEDYQKLQQADKVKVREALYQHIDLLDSFITENPAGFSPEELEIVRGWKGFISGDFYIFKYLKRHTVFVAADNSEQVYGVLALYDALEDMFYGRPLPILVKAYLLPFKGQIIYDGLLSGYSVFFGPGIRGSINEIYQRARQNSRIITSLEPQAEAAKKPAKLVRDWSPTLEDITKQAQKLRQANTVIEGKAFALLKSSAELAQAAHGNPGNLDELYKLAKRAERALNQLWTALDRAD